MHYINTTTGEKALLVSFTNAGTDELVKPRYTFIGEKGRFFVEGEEIKQWVPSK